MTQRRSPPAHRSPGAPRNVSTPKLLQLHSHTGTVLFMRAKPPIWKKSQGQPECSDTGRTGTDDVPQKEGPCPDLLEAERWEDRTDLRQNRFQARVCAFPGRRPEVPVTQIWNSKQDAHPAAETGTSLPLRSRFLRSRDEGQTAGFTCPSPPLEPSDGALSRGHPPTVGQACTWFPAGSGPRQQGVTLEPTGLATWHGEAAGPSRRAGAG